MTRNNYKIIQCGKKSGEKKVADYTDVYGYKKVGEKTKKLNKIPVQDETKEPTKYGKFTRHHPDEPVFHHKQSINKIRLYRRD